jgi:hypothetical protein
MQKSSNAAVFSPANNTHISLGGSGTEPASHF